MKVRLIDTANIIGDVVFLMDLYKRYKYEVVSNKIKSLSIIEWNKLVSEYNSYTCNLFHDIFIQEKRPDDRYIEQTIGKTSPYRDKRSAYDFFCDVIIGWLIEDYVKIVLEEFFSKTILKGDIIEYKVSYYNPYTARKLVTSNTSTADIRIYKKYNDNKQEFVNIEIMSNWIIKDNKTYWELNGFFDLRYNKLKNLIDISKEDKTYILLYIPEKDKSFFINVADIKEKKYNTENVLIKEFGYKYGVRVFIDNIIDRMKSFSRIYYNL